MPQYLSGVSWLQGEMLRLLSLRHLWHEMLPSKALSSSGSIWTHLGPLYSVMLEQLALLQKVPRAPCKKFTTR